RGRVPSEADFYDEVDYAIAPVFAGTGFKVKTADALAMATPLLASSHAAEGVALDRDLVCDTPRDMAARMVEISLRRPSPRAAQATVMRARADLRARASAGGADLLRAMAWQADPCVIDLHDASLERDALKLHSWLAMLRGLAKQTRVLLLLPPPLRALLASVLPPGAAALDLAAFEVARDAWPRHRYVDATASGAQRTCHCRDDRWDADAEDGDAPPFEMPVVHPDFGWEPAAQRLRRAWSAARPSAPDGTTVLLDAALPARTFAEAGLELRHDAAALAMEMLCGRRPAEIVLGAAVGTRARSVVAQVCALAGVRLRGRIDCAALAREAAPAAIAEELAGAIDRALRAQLERKQT
ncbi:MAG: hypothetical protein JOY70_11515, partial [Acidisphaera sp.]|nr:hypothetical protein [Acidisphaera sp.]